jgi:hypothetical protein
VRNVEACPSSWAASFAAKGVTVVCMARTLLHKFRNYASRALRNMGIKDGFCG